MKKCVYKKNDYNSGLRKVQSQLDLIDSMIYELDEMQLNWDFKRFGTYKITLTLYGPGGSYNPDDGSILMYTTTEGGFKNYGNPANTIIHEIVHIGIEEALVNQYELSHPMKERIVDNIVHLCFGGRLPEYKIQDMGDARIDKYLDEKTDIKYLNKNIELAIQNKSKRSDNKNFKNKSLIE